MRAYLVSVEKTDESGNAVLYKRYAGSMAEAREGRRHFIADLGVRMAYVSIEEIEVPTSKSGLIPWLNAYAV